jgi:hypothetical protein
LFFHKDDAIRSLIQLSEYDEKYRCNECNQFDPIPIHEKILPVTEGTAGNMPLERHRTKRKGW